MNSQPGQLIRTDKLVDAYAAVRRFSVALCAPLATEDYGVQPMDDASPPKWHLAHTTWFFETFILKALDPTHAPYDPAYEYLFNSYYNGVGEPYPRSRRGLLSRPTVAAIQDYRRVIDERMAALLSRYDSLHETDQNILLQRLELGLHHEQQHQELLLTDIKYNFGNNPLYPVYGGGPALQDAVANDLNFHEFAGGVVPIGAESESAFAFDNERPRHDVLVHPFALADRLVTNADYLAFVNQGGYENPQHWLSEGWALVTAGQMKSPLYWQQRDGEWFEYRLDGLHPLQGHLPVVHVSAHEAYAYATWADCRLPTEFEWECAAENVPLEGTFVDAQCFHPNSCPSANGSIRQLYGDVWQWTSSSYGPYPGYQPLAGTLGEYNGKFMSSQLVLRGGSCATSRDHMRKSYRNFFYPADRWQFSGIRLARDLLRNA
jgi:ergothioneine biosynthesis protein EgtB